jgi:hypothetical protein
MDRAGLRPFGKQEVFNPGKPTARTPRPILDAQQSAKLRDTLIAEIERIDSADEAAVWAHRNLTAKNTLTATDASAVEDAFQVRLAAFEQAGLPGDRNSRAAPDGRGADLCTPLCAVHPGREVRRFGQPKCPHGARNLL